MSEILTTSLHIYPIKSLGSIDLQEAEAQERGFRFDRRMALVDHNNETITQRTVPAMVLLEVSFSDKIDGSLVVRSKKSKASVEIKTSDFTGKREEVSIWGNIVRSTSARAEINKWFSEQLQAACRLVWMEDRDSRMIDQLYGKSEVSFADGYPYLLTNKASLDDLNSRLRHPVGMERFRPNIVIEGIGSFMEDDFQSIRIGQVELRKTKPCSRCVLTTVDPETATLGKEPLKTLSEYRKINNDVYFGINMICTKPGNIQVGSHVEIL